MGISFYRPSEQRLNIEVFKGKSRVIKGYLEKLSTLGVHPNGVVNETNRFWTDFNPHADLSNS